MESRENCHFSGCVVKGSVTDAELRKWILGHDDDG